MMPEGFAAIDSAPWAVFARYGRGEATDEERSMLRLWASEEPSRLALLNGVARLGALSRHCGAERRTDIAWSRVRKYMDDADRPVSVLRLEAASPAAADVPRAWPWRRLRSRIGVAASLAVLLFSTGWWMVNGSRGRDVAPRFEEAAAPTGARVSLGLPDGTRAILGPESRMRYAVGRDSRTRDVYLVGLAFFEVAPDAQRPFIVRAPGGQVQVVGTSFMVRAYPEDSALSVVVAEGGVALRSEGAAMGSGTVLEPGEHGTLSRGLVRVDRNVDVAHELGWTEGRLAYDLVPLDRILRDLERWFHVRISTTNTELRQVRVTVTLDTESVDSALRRLATVLETRYTRSGAEVRLGP